MRHGFYVYYKIKAADEPAAREAIKQLFSELNAQTGVAGRLLHRADEPDTWMEIYEHIAEATHFRAALDATTLHSGLLSLIEPGRRHVEHFHESNAV